MITGMDRCLFAYTLEGWGQVETRILAAGGKQRHHAPLSPLIRGQCARMPVRSPRRVLIPPQLRTYAALDKEIVLVGVLNHFEVWSKENWDKENENDGTGHAKGGGT
jgi:MraZ protein